MARRFYSTVASKTSLSSPAGLADTTLFVSALSGYPAQFPYTVILDRGTASEEIVEVTAASGTAITVVRGVDGSTAKTHGPGAAFEHGVSARDFDEPNQIAAGGGTIQAPAAAVVPLVVKGAASQTTNLFEARDAAGALRARVFADGAIATQGQIGVGGDPEANQRATISSGSSGVKGLVVRGAASQSANLAEFQNSAGTVLATVLADGRISVRNTGSDPTLGINASFTANNADRATGIAVVGANPAASGLVIRGAASQTANLAEFQNSAGGVMTGVTAGGRFTFTSANHAATFQATATAGTNGATPTQVAGYMVIEIDGVLRKIPYYGN